MARLAQFAAQAAERRPTTAATPNVATENAKNGGAAKRSDASPSLSHVDSAGKARMVDVGAKPDTERVAEAKGSVTMSPETLRLIKEGGFEKGDVLGTARIAGVMAAKQTSNLIPSATHCR